MKESIEKYKFEISLGVAISVIIFLVIVSTNLATWKTNIEAQNKVFDTRITIVTKQADTMQKDIDLLDDKATGRDIQLAEIKTQLTQIQETLLEIKLDLKEQRG